MAAFTGSPSKSTQRTAQVDNTKVKQEDWGRIQYARFDYTHTLGAGTGEVNLIKLPGGKIRVFHALSRVVSSAMVATADLHIGHRAFVDAAGATVAEDDNEWLDNADAGAAIDSAFLLPGAEVYDTRDGLEIYAMIDTANIEDTDTIVGWIAYARGG